MDSPKIVDLRSEIANASEQFADLRRRFREHECESHFVFTCKNVKHFIKITGLYHCEAEQTAKFCGQKLDDDEVKDYEKSYKLGYDLLKIMRHLAELRCELKKVIGEFKKSSN